MFYGRYAELSMPRPCSQRWDARAAARRTHAQQNNFFGVPEYPIRLKPWTLKHKPHLGGVAGDEVVHGLLAREPRHGRQHAKCVAAQQDKVLGVRADAGGARVVDVLDRVRRARVLRHRAAQAPAQRSSAYCWGLQTLIRPWIARPQQHALANLVPLYKLEHPNVSRVQRFRHVAVTASPRAAACATGSETGHCAKAKRCLITNQTHTSQVWNPSAS